MPSWGGSKHTLCFSCNFVLQIYQHGAKKRGEAHCHLDLYIPVTLQRGLKAQLWDHLASITSFLLITHKQRQAVRQAVRQDGSPLLLRILSPLGGAHHLPSLGGSAMSAGEAFPVIAKGDCQQGSVEEGIYVAFYALEGAEEWIGHLR